MRDLSHECKNRWVFGYGSLIWRPGFDYVDSRQALLRGAHRSLCIYSHEHRGSPEQPGLVFGLRRGGSCRGMAFAVSHERWTEVREYLRIREQVTGVYRPVDRPVRLDDGQVVSALTFVVDEGHAQFAGRLCVEEQLGVVRKGHGLSGANVDYVLNTVAHLKTMGLRDPHLFELADRLLAERAAA
jgi:glutathione-specific gamma-glutamylcyclotransferase